MDPNGWIRELLRQFSLENEKTAFEIYDGNQVTFVTYEQFAKDILQAAGFFAEKQIAGKHIAIAAPNSYQWIVVFFAVAASGNVAVPLNQELPAELLQWQCQQADVAMVCCSNANTLEKIGNVPAVFFETIQAVPPLALECVHTHAEEETLLMMFTSGTTGKSKTVVLSAKNLYVSATNMFSRREQDFEKTLISLPLFHVGSVRTLLNRLICKAELAMGRGAMYIFMDMPKLNPTHVGMVPAMAESLAKIMRRTPAEKMMNYLGNNFQGIMAVGASMKPSVARYLLEQNVGINVIFGMTESAGDGSCCLLDEKHIGTIGKPDGNIAFRMEAGEILLRSEGVMQGYYNDPEETAKVIVDGWLHTGDMGHCDEDGYYYITGRKKNVIILSNGENVNPEEIEAAFSECDAIEESLVYSDGKGICADVFTADQTAADAFIGSYNSSMPKYRQVYKVIYSADPLPKTGSGKIKRKQNL